MSSVAGIRARNRAAIEGEILRVGREHLASHGAAGLSLRAVARDLGMASSAVYRYVASRDELLTRLIVTAYDAMADAVEGALAALPATSGADRRFRAIATASRAWATANPHEYALIYGSPVPDYHAPAERTNDAGTRVPAMLTGVLAGIDRAGRRDTRRDRAALGATLDDPFFAGSGLTAGAVRRGFTAWILVLGTISAELFEQFGADTVGDWDAFFDAVVDDAMGIVTG
ncbi:MAG: TetR/AcrR family transcriptional regulator [Nocardioidaceae bacterium]